MSDRCPDCGYPVGWDRLAGECPRNMQNYQSEDCKARQTAALRSRITQLEAVLTDFRDGSERRLAALAVAAAELEARYSESQARVAELEAKDIESEWLDMSRCIREQRERIAKLEAVVAAADAMRLHVSSIYGHNSGRAYDAAKDELERVTNG